MKKKVKNKKSKSSKRKKGSIPIGKDRELPKQFVNNVDGFGKV